MVKSGIRNRVINGNSRPAFRSAEAASKKARRAAKTAARRDAREAIEAGLADAAEERRLVAALAHLDQVVAKWRSTAISFWNEDYASWEIGQAGREAGLTKKQRDEIKLSVIGSKCSQCLSRLCNGDHSNDWRHDAVY